MHELEAAWFGKIRSSGLHNLDNWIKDLTIHISYVPTGFGAKGHEKCAKFFTAFPHSRHLLNADQLERLGGSIETVSVTVDEKRSRLVEEAIVRTVHYERIDWLAPGIEGTNRQIILPFVIMRTYINLIRRFLLPLLVIMGFFNRFMCIGNMHLCFSSLDS